MSLGQAKLEIDYPESDGKPMGETDLHRDWMVRILEILRQRYRGQQVYLASDLLVYFEEGNPKRFVVPDVFAVLGAAPGRRRTYKIWEEIGPPNVTFEVTSRATRREDEHGKPQRYADMGVQEYFLYDPTADWLDPPLQGFHLSRGGYQRHLPDERRMLTCQTLDILLRLEDDALVMYDRETEQVLLTEAEANAAVAEANAAEAAANAAKAKVESARAEAEKARAEAMAAEARAKAAQAEAESARAAAAEQRAAELEAELNRIREDRGGEPADS